MKIQLNFYNTTGKEHGLVYSMEASGPEFLPRIGERFIFMKGVDTYDSMKVNGIVKNITHIYYEVTDVHIINIILEED